MTEEQRLQRRMDEENIQMEVLMRGDATNFPVSTSDICFEMHYQVFD